MHFTKMGFNLFSSSPEVYVPLVPEAGWDTGFPGTEGPALEEDAFVAFLESPRHIVSKLP